MVSQEWRKRIDQRLDGEKKAEENIPQNVSPMQKPEEPKDIKPNVNSNVINNIHRLNAADTYNKNTNAEASDGGENAAVIAELKKKIEMSKKMSQKSIIPPSIDPPQIPKSRTVNSIRHNVRAYVIGFCFLWGTLLGFLYHITRENPIEEEDNNIPVIVNSKPQNIQDIIKSKNADDKAKNSGETLPAIKKVDIPINTEAADEIIRDSEKQLRNIRTARRERSQHKVAPLPKINYGGISGINAPLPKFKDTRNSRLNTSAGPEPDLSIGGSELMGPELE